MFKTITSAKLLTQLKQTPQPIIDVREDYEFQGGHIPGAKNLPLSELSTRYQELDQKTPYYVICHSGARSGNACAFLSQQGYNVTNIMGGMAEWQGAVD